MKHQVFDLLCGLSQPCAHDFDELMASSGLSRTSGTKSRRSISIKSPSSMITASAVRAPPSSNAISPNISPEGIKLNMAVIAATGGAASASAVQAGNNDDPHRLRRRRRPVKLSLVANLARLVPSAACIAVLINPTNVQGAATAVAEVEAAAPSSPCWCR